MGILKIKFLKFYSGPGEISKLFFYPEILVSLELIKYKPTLIKYKRKIHFENDRK